METESRDTRVIMKETKGVKQVGGGGLDLLGKKKTTLFCRDFRKQLVSSEHAKGETKQTKSAIIFQSFSLFTLV